MLYLLHNFASTFLVRPRHLHRHSTTPPPLGRAYDIVQMQIHPTANKCKPTLMTSLFLITSPPNYRGTIDTTVVCNPPYMMPPPLCPLAAGVAPPPPSAAAAALALPTITAATVLLYYPPPPLETTTTTALATAPIADKKLIMVMSSPPPHASAVALPLPTPISIAYTPPPVTTVFTPPPPEAIICLGVDYFCCVSGSQGRGNNGGGASRDDRLLVDGRNQPPATANPIVSEEELEIGTSLKSPPPPAWGLDEK